MAEDTDAPRRVQRSRLDTRSLPPRRALEAWHEHFGQFFDLSFRNRVGEAFHGNVDAFLLGNTILGTVRSVSQGYTRSRHRIARDGLSHYGLLVQVSGKTGRWGAGTDETAAAGDIFICDMAQPHRSESAEPDSLNLVVPRPLLAPLLKAPDGHNLRVLRGRDPLVALLRSHLLALYREAPGMDLDAAQAALAPTLALCAAALNAAVSEETAAAVRVALTEQIRRYIDARLADPSLSAALVATRFGISLRKLYYLLEPYGGFACYVQEVKLRRCHVELVDPAHRHRRIGEIAEAYGFRHRKNFVAAFRRCFDMTPSAVRILADEGRHRGYRSAAGPDWRDWFRTVR